MNKIYSVCFLFLYMIGQIVHPCTQYAHDVVNGSRVAGKLELLACQRHLDDLSRQGTEDFPYIFDEEKANKIYKWFRYCKHVEGPLAGKPIELLPFQKFDLGCIFGWVHKDTGTRRFEKAYNQMARKNAKTTILSGVALYLMVGDQEESPSVYCAAVDRGQARILYEASKMMAEKSPDIRKRLRIRDYKISHASRGGRMVALSKDTKNKDGLNPSGAIIDEYHAHPTSEIYDLLWSAWGQRGQALMTIITTAGFDLSAPCYEEYRYCTQILTRQVTNERYFVIIRQLDEGDNEHDPANWIKANPLRAATPEGVARLKQQHDEAFDSKNPEKIRTFRVKQLNIWVHQVENSYMGDLMQVWPKLAIPRDAFIELTRGKICNVGVDLSKKIDLTASGFVFALDDERIAVTAQGYMPSDAVSKHQKTDKIPYRDWAAEGWLDVTEGNVTDYRYIQSSIKQAETEYDWRMHEICFDPYNATHFANELMDEGYTCIEIRQGVKTLSEPTKLFRELVASGKVVHDGSPLLTWCLGNAVEEIDNNENIKLSKKNAGDTRRIDLIAAIINAVVRIQALREANYFADYVNSDEFSY